MERISHNPLEKLSQDYPSVFGKKDRVEYEKKYAPVTERDLRSACEGNEELLRLLDSMMEHCCRYAQDVWEMQEMIVRGEISSEAYQEKDAARTVLHNATMDSINIFSRNLVKNGGDNSWMHDVVPNGRAGYARLAILLAVWHYLDGVDSNSNGEGHETAH